MAAALLIIHLGLIPLRDRWVRNPVYNAGRFDPGVFSRVINLRATLYLLSFPMGFMGLVQAFFALLSWLVFGDGEEAEFFLPSAVNMKNLQAEVIHRD